MPRLPSEAASAAKKAAESSGFVAVEEGEYRLRLTDVKATTAKSSGNPMWVWEFESVQEGSRGRKFWVNTVLTDAAMWKLGETFAAFGADTDADTDDLIGEEVMAHISQTPITQGARAGQMGNNVDRCYPTEERQAEIDANGGVAAYSAGAAEADAATGDAPAGGW